MSVMTSEWEERLTHWHATLKKDLYRPIGEIRWEAFFTMDYLTLEQAKLGAFRPVEPGFEWGHLWEYGWFHGTVVIPEEARGKRINIDAAPGGEATIFVNDKAFGTYRADWVDEAHHYIEDNTLTRDAVPGDVYDIYMEVYAGHYFPVSLAAGGHTVTGPVMPGDFQDPAVEGKRRTLGNSTFGVWNEAAYQLYMDVSTLKSLLKVLDEDSLRAVKVATALEQFTLDVDFEQEQEGRNRDYLKARENLRPTMEAVNGSTQARFYAVGNAHIDLAWLWPMAETYRKTARTFAAQLRLLEEYPDYKYIQSQPAAFEMCRKNYPELFERIREAVKGGRFIVDGAMWVEPDTNLTGGESLVRQLFYGKQYYKNVFDTDAQILWLPDSFGYSAALPQILQDCGVHYLVTQKIFWSYNDGEKFPYHYFTWEGMDGSHITTFLPTSYTYKTTPEEANGVWKKRTQRKDLEAFLFPFGYGDGGGGPCRDHIEYAKRYENLEGAVQMKMAGPMEFFKDMEAEGGPKQRYVGELYFEAHRGTYTTQALMKRNNRRGEFMMHDLEFLGALAALLGHAYDEDKAAEMWKTILLHQFHDILPGSSIGRVYKEAAAVYEELLAEGDSWKAAITGSMTEGEGVTVFNALGFARKAVVVLPSSFKDGAVVADSREPVAVYMAKSEGEDVVKAVVSLPAFGAVSLIPAETEAPAAVTLKKNGENYVFENSCLIAVVNQDAEVISLRLKDSDGKLNPREFAAGPMNRLHLFKDVPRRYDAWDLDSNYVNCEIPDAGRVTRIEIVQAQGAEAVLAVRGVIDNSTYSQEIVLEAESKRLEFRTHVEWHEKHRLLKAAFPVNVYAQNAIHEIQFGYAERPTHRSRPYDQQRFEVCNHRYTALAEANHGAAVLNNCKYGVSVNDNSIELTLLRAAATPDPDADRGPNDFTYAVTAWEGSFFDSDVVKQGYELNEAPVLQAGSMPSFSAFSVDAPNVIIETVKPASDRSGDIIFRLYESKKAETFAALTIDLAAFGVTDYEVRATNMLEAEDAPVDAQNLHFKPFEIKTLRIRRK